MIFRGLFTLLALFIFTLPLLPVQLFFNIFALPARHQLPIFWHKTAARLIGLKVSQKGQLAANRPLLITSNHISWLDIVALSTCGPISFIAKREVSGWFAFGTLAKLQRTVFINRERRSATGNKTNEIAKRLNDGDVMVLFAEGTSSAGATVLPFRSALLGAAQKAGAEANQTIWIQPAALAYTHLYGMPTTIHERSRTGFYGDMDMAPHLMRTLREGAIDVSVIFGDPIAVNASTDRKALAKTLEEAVRSMRTEMVRG